VLNVGEEVAQEIKQSYDSTGLPSVVMLVVIMNPMRTAQKFHLSHFDRFGSGRSRDSHKNLGSCLEDSRSHTETALGSLEQAGIVLEASTVLAEVAVRVVVVFDVPSVATLVVETALVEEVAMVE